MCTQKTDGSEYVTAEEVAADLGTTPLRVLMLIKEKALNGVLRDGAWLVTRESLACFRTRGANLSLQNSCRSSCTSSGCGCK